MGIGNFLKKVGDATKKAMDRAAKEAKYRAKALDIKREIAKAERKFREEVARKEFEVKREILSQLKMRQLEAVCAAKGIPTYRTKIVNGEERRYKIRNKDELIDVVASHLTLEEVAEVAKRYKVKSRHVIQHFQKWLEEANEALGHSRSRSRESLMSTKFNFLVRVLEMLKLLSLRRRHYLPLEETNRMRYTPSRRGITSRNRILWTFSLTLSLKQ